MDEFWKLGGFPAVGDADPVPASVFTNLPEHGRTLALLHDVSRELTAILNQLRTVTAKWESEAAKLVELETNSSAVARSQD